eukprot:245597_1
MEPLLILLSIATNPFNTTSKLSISVSTSSLAQCNPNQNIKYIHFADSHLFGLLYENTDAVNIPPIFENFMPTEITNSYSLCIKPSPREPFIKIGNVLEHLYMHEYHGQKNVVWFQKISSETMGKIYKSHLIWNKCEETSNIQCMISTSSFGYTMMAIENVELPYEMILDMVNIKIWGIMKLKTNGTIDVWDF